MAKLGTYFIIALLLVTLVNQSESGPIMAKLLKFKKLAMIKAPLLAKGALLFAKPLLKKPLMLAKPLLAKAAFKAKAIPMIMKKKVVG